MEILFNEQDIIDSISVYAAERDHVAPQSVQVQLEYNVNFGIAAKVVTFSGEWGCNEQDIIDSIATYLRDYHQFQPDRLMIELGYDEDEGITASILVN
ncbi:DUF2653 family protein [Neobacillus dielmonensis]|uniref:DUF2653 family protein n=1 Tax=Neobacillus dielmonensis TaxID=1347369 RepID=UPI0005A65EC8|nr:DUF2653 family protein [Neobacillus dielmonensis]